MPTATVDPTTSVQPERWTNLNIWLHWIILGLLVVQWIIGEWMVDFFDAGLGEGQANTLTVALGYLHIATGATIFVAIAVRLWDRFAHGRPAYPDGEPNWAGGLAKLTHFGLYAVLLAMPLAGAYAWLFGSEQVATWHEWGWTALLVLAGVHVAGVLANQFWFKTDVLRRMVPGRGRPA